MPLPFHLSEKFSEHLLGAGDLAAEIRLCLWGAHVAGGKGTVETDMHTGDNAGTKEKPGAMELLRSEDPSSGWGLGVLP